MPLDSSTALRAAREERGGPRAGCVALVGAGPGDPDLLTVRAARLIGRADVVLVDALVDERVLELVRPGARVVDVGKIGGGPQTAQELTCGMLVEEARAGRFVVRLKGGDPYVFGRGSEEALALAMHGIRCEVVPGLSSALAVPALAGIPVTHRGVATSFTVLTGMTRVRVSPEAAWRAAAHTGGTLVFLMAVRVVERIVEVLLEEGRRPDTPVAIVENGAQLGERVTTTTLERLAVEARVLRVQAPAVIVVGDVVSVRAAVVASSWAADAVAEAVAEGGVDVPV